MADISAIKLPDGVTYNIKDTTKSDATNWVNGSATGSVRTVGSAAEDNSYTMGTYAVAEGNSTKASGEYGSHAEGASTVASGNGAHAEGLSTTASNYGAHAEGASTVASGYYSHAEGTQTRADGEGAHAEGYTTKAYGQGSHAEGANTQVTSSATAGHAEGANTVVNAVYGHVEGSGATVYGKYAHAEGSGTSASGEASHAEGAGTYANGAQSHAEGGGTHADGAQSHAEGAATSASGHQSHAEGSNTSASGLNSHAEGSYTIANHLAQHVFGEYNIADDSTATTSNRGNYVEIVGNGSSSTRSNARTLDWSGNEVLAGKLTVGAVGTNSMDVATVGQLPTIPANIVNTITTTAGAHIAISNQKGNVSFNVPTKTSHLTNDSGFITNAGVTGVKGNAESSYRTGQVNLTAANIGAISKSDELLTTNTFAPNSLKGPYISKIDNAFYAADKRWTITATNTSSNVSVLFDGSYETQFRVNDGETSVITFDFSNSTYFPGYPYGYILVSFYYVAKPASISGRVYCNYSSQGIGWHDISFTPIVDNATSQITYRSEHQGYYQISQLEITVVGDTSNSYGYTAITQIEMHLDRPDSSRNPFLSKYGAETLYYDLTAPNFRGNLTGNVTGNVSGSAGSVAWSGVTSKPTTLSGYGITDAKISNGTITLGSNTITPLTSYTETDPVFSASAAYGISTTDITNWNSKQAALVSGTNIKTINGYSLLGSGDISILSDDEVFIAEYDYTSFGAIEAALSAGKVVFCRKKFVQDASSTPYRYLSVYQYNPNASSFGICFLDIHVPQTGWQWVDVECVWCKPSGGWSVEYQRQLAACYSPPLTGTPTAPTAAVGTNTTQIATTAFVTNAVSTTTQIVRWTETT